MKTADISKAFTSPLKMCPVTGKICKYLISDVCLLERMIVRDIYHCVYTVDDAVGDNG